VNRRINKLEQSLKKQDYDRDHPASSLGSVVGAASTSWFNQTKDTMSAQAPTQKQLINVDTATHHGGSILTVPIEKVQNLLLMPIQVIFQISHHTSPQNQVRK